MCGERAMATIVGTGDFKYRVIENWAKLPDGWSFKEVAAVGVDKNDNVYVFNRGEHPVMVFDREGNFLRPWRAQMLARRQDPARDRHPRQAGAVYERRAVPPLYAHRAVAKGRDLCL